MSENSNCSTILSVKLRANSKVVVFFYFVLVPIDTIFPHIVSALE